MTIFIQLDSDSELQALAGLLGKRVEIARDSAKRRWLRATDSDPQLLARLTQVPGRCFRLSDERRLIRAGDQVASELLEDDLQWHRLDDQWSLALPVAALSGKLDPSERRTLRLVRGGEPNAAAAAIIRLNELRDWADLASEVRLRRLRWVANGCEALVMGDPLPPVDARYLIAIGRVLIPAGHHWLPSVPAIDVCAAVGLKRDQWLVWHSENQWNIVNDDAFATLRRAAVRQLCDRQFREFAS